MACEGTESTAGGWVGQVPLRQVAQVAGGKEEVGKTLWRGKWLRGEATGSMCYGVQGMGVRPLIPCHCFLCCSSGGMNLRWLPNS